MPLELQDPQKSIADCISFIQKTVTKTGKNMVVVAVSGGIDSAVSLTLATRATGADHVQAVFLPYKTQSTSDAVAIADFNLIPAQNRHQVNIAHLVDSLAEQLQAMADQVRLGNIMARTRMIVTYDIAKRLDALVCGTENKSEKYLGYFTRFGDEASDIEPIQHLYKTQIRQIAQTLQLPSQFLEKPPSAGLWQGQTDEEELGFSYEEADKALLELIDKKKASADPKIKELVAARVKSQHFKHEVPYTL